jgi:hypothetical protein
MTALDKDALNLGEPITHSQPVLVFREKVWEVISRPGNLVDFHPFCRSNPVEIWPGVGSRDKVVYYNGLVLVREFTTWLKGTGYDLIASAQDDMQFKVSWRITTDGDESSALTLTIRQVIGDSSEKRVKLFSRLLEKYLKQVGQGFEYSLRTGERVTRNQFGSHRLFSPPVAKEVNP